MTTFDPTRILSLARTLESGTTDEKLTLLEQLDATQAVDSGVLMRALQDPERAVRLTALERLSQAGVRPMEMVLTELRDDEDEEIRALALELAARPDTTNPLEQLIPLIERLADSLGPLGGMIRSMVEAMRGIAEEDERGQLRTLARLDGANPASILVLQQALRSPFIAVRLAALRKVLEVEGARVPEDLITHFATDPSPEIRETAEAVIRAGKVGSLDESALRTHLMGAMMASLGGAGGLDLGALFGGSGGLDLGALLKGSGLGGGGLDLGELLGGGNGSAAGTSAGPVEGRAHEPTGTLYIVGEARVCERLARSLGRLALDDREPSASQLEHGGTPARWAMTPVEHEPMQTPAWIETLFGAGLDVPEAWVAQAEQARFLSEQIWGAAWADHSGPLAATLVFHDGILSRAEWSGTAEGAYSGETGTLDPGEQGPLALLCAFLADPTDDKLLDLPEAQPLVEARG